MTQLPLKQQIEQAVKAAMRDKAKEKRDALRQILAAIKQIEVDERIDGLDDKRVLAVLVKLCKQTKESVELFVSGGREDLVQKAQFELDVYQSFLPKPLSDSEVTQLVQEHIALQNASGMKDMGKVMASLKPIVQGRADGAMVSRVVKKQLAEIS